MIHTYLFCSICRPLVILWGRDLRQVRDLFRQPLLDALGHRENVKAGPQKNLHHFCVTAKLILYISIVRMSCMSKWIISWGKQIRYCNTTVFMHAQQFNCMLTVFSCSAREHPVGIAKAIVVDAYHELWQLLVYLLGQVVLNAEAHVCLVRPVVLCRTRNNHFHHIKYEGVASSSEPVTTVAWKQSRRVVVSSPQKGLV